MNRRWWVLATSVVLVAAAACDVPTSTPKWDQTWIVPGEDMSLSVAELLPAGVTLTSDSSAFVVNINGMSDSFTLGEFCSACTFLNGLTVPKPAFDSTLYTTQTLPSDVVSATADAGQVSLTIQHSFNFDPLRPSSNPANTGFMTMSVRSAGRLVAYDSIDGADADGAFPPNTPRTLTVPVTPGPLSDSLVIAFRISSPAGDPTTINTSQALFVTLQPGTLDISQAEVVVDNLTADGTPSTMDVSGLPDFVVNHVQSGALRFTIDNPFDVSGTFTLTLTTSNGTPLIKTLDIVPGASTPRIDFTGPELQSLLDQGSILVTSTGQVSASGGTVTVTPDQVMTLKTELEVSNLVGGEVNQ
ncbi:MAG: hypothetical protein P8Z36_04435 [Gemmatimonadota bacterium]|jgi:hypothetical protein